VLFAGCKAAQTYPSDEPLFLVDVGNKVCAEYRVVDVVNVKVKLFAEHPLAKCQDVVGYSRKGFKRVQNWARDNQQ
jgi:hypothetical protein